MIRQNAVPRNSVVGVAVLLVAVGAVCAWGAAISQAQIFVYEKDNIPTSRIFVQEDGGSPEALSLVGQEPALAPDEQRLAFVSGHPGSSWPTSIAVADIEGHGPRPIIEVGEPDWEYQPALAWTPDGTSLLASGYGDGDIVELRPVQSQPEWSVTEVINWPGMQWGLPAISPDGTKIAFISNTNPAGEPLGAEGSALYVANRNGSNPERLTSKGAYPGSPTFSPDSTKIAFGGYEGGVGDAEIFVVNLETLSLKAITSNTAEDWSPDWRTDGRIGFSRSTYVNGYQHGEFRVMNSDGTKSELTAGPFSTESGSFWGPPSYAAIPGEPVTLGPESEAQAKKLLLRFAPKLRYDSQETFRAMTADSFTDYYGPGNEPGESNLLRYIGPEEEPGENVIAYSNPVLSGGDLGLGYLRPFGQNYPESGPLVLEPHQLSAHGNSEGDASEDIQSLEEEGGYENTVYGRVKYSGGEWWLQYWFFYYYNPWLPTQIGDHEGDWEMIQVALDSDAKPTRVVYAQHHGGEICSWSDLHTSIGYYGNIAPDVFVGRGSHASYMDDSEDMELGDTNDDTYPMPVKVAPMDESMDWVLWPGYWGDSASSPHSPFEQGDKWSDPEAFAENAAFCRVESPSARSAQDASPSEETRAAKRPAKPGLTARRKGDQILVTYRAPDSATNVTAVVITAARSRSDLPPTGETIRTKDGEGTVSIPVPAGRGRLVVSGRVMSATAQSEPATTSVP